METVSGQLRLSATDLVGHLNCRHLTELDRAVANGALARPFVWDSLLEVLWERGLRHEAGFVDHLEKAGEPILKIEGVGIDAAAVEATRAAMLGGAPVIVQGALQSGRWGGRADILKRVERPSSLGAWSYEPWDTKLARETKAGAVLQLCLYADLLHDAQGVVPERAYVVAPWTDYIPQEYRIAEFAAYFRRVKQSLEHAVQEVDGAIYPEPTEYCEICRWQARCDGRRREDDHLSLVAGISKTQINELRAHGVATTADLSAMPIPLPWRPERGARESYDRIREQGRIQVQGREAGETLYELLTVLPEFGLSCLPEPSAGDVFLDLEGDPFVGPHGLEYLFGYAWRDEDGQERYTGDWALTREREVQVFERFIDFVIARQAQWQNLHIYHFAPYEPAALKRLMGRYATRGEEVDKLLRGRVFVDLFAVVRHSVRASVESYSIKKLEPLYGFERQTPLAAANQALTKLQTCIELDDVDTLTPEDGEIVEGYNRDDCVSTARLRDWLEARRAELVENGVEIARPIAPPADPNENVAAWLQRVEPVIAALKAGLPVDLADRSPVEQGRWLLANCLDWHRREQKSVWWEYFRLSDLTAEDLLEERPGLSGLEFVDAVGGTLKAPIHRYRFPPQETELRGGETLRNVGGAAFGKVEAISREDRYVDIKKRQDTASAHPAAVFSHSSFGIDVQQESLLRLGEYVAAHGMEGSGAYQATRELLICASSPDDTPLQREDETPLEAALRLALDLPGGVLPIQGPPGSGKTYTGAQIICRLVAAGRSVAVTANSHKVIRNLLDAVVEAAVEIGLDLSCLQKPDEAEDDTDRLKFTTDNAAVFAAIGQTCHVAGGTVWLWSRPEAFECVDVLVVDEAAQMSLANVLAVSQCAGTVILLGDPQQLDQPMQGSHPEGTDVSALHHLLDGHETIPPERGLFLAQTWRLPPAICDFTSELFYEGRLEPLDSTKHQVLLGAGELSGSGLRFLPVAHHGNQNASPEEADRVAALVAQLLAMKPQWVDRKGDVRDLDLSDILVIAPYNAQVFELQARLPPGSRVGTVDKFQGQEAPLVIYSLATSTCADAPRGMEFLYSLNRLNVATSRAQCVCVIVASPAVFEADCRTPRQMQLVNAFCRYMELAELIWATTYLTQ